MPEPERQNLRREVYGDGKCAVGDCLSPWARWCRNCNLVYCGVHHENHECLGPGEKKGARPPTSRDLGGLALERGGNRGRRPGRAPTPVPPIAVTDTHNIHRNGSAGKEKA